MNNACEPGKGATPLHVLQLSSLVGPSSFRLLSIRKVARVACY